MGRRYKQNMYHVNVNVSLIVANVTRIKIGIMINVRASAKVQKNIVCAEKIIAEIPLHVAVKVVSV